MKKGICVILIIGILGITNVFVTNINSAQSIEPFFSLVAKTNEGGIRPDYLYLTKQYLSSIGINLDVQILDWPSFVGELIFFRDFDICAIALSGGSADPDFTGVYNENGSLNLFGYNTTMDWDSSLGTGKNEWYIREGLLIMPPDSQERINHYWEWEQYMMDKICPLLPTFVPQNYMGYWSNLQGYNFSKGLLQSWGNMKWNGAHSGQTSTDEIVISDAAWSDLNPIFQDDSSSSFISNALMDRLLIYDQNTGYWPHLAEEWTFLSDNHLRIKIREGIKWSVDPEGMFQNEYLDVKDVYFSLYIWGYFAWGLTDFIEDIEIVDNYTFDIFIDGDPSTPEKEPYSSSLSSLGIVIMPEHYLNQSQFADGVTPDLTHEAWDTFATQAFGTGLFTLDNFEEGEETVLQINPESWWLNESITSDPKLQWENRFGDFSSVINRLRIKIIRFANERIQRFYNGEIDFAGLTNHPIERDNCITNPDFEVQSELQNYFNFIGYNMREIRDYIGSQEPCPGDPTISIGLAIRKAISYVIDRVEMNKILHKGEYIISHWPIYMTQKIWCNPNIIRYDFDLVKAREYMELAGFDFSIENTQQSTILFLPFLLTVPILVFTRKRKMNR